jgi:hypothetical protein
MADQKVSQLPALLGANTAAGDLIYIVDISEPLPADQSKKITLTEFQSAPVSAGTANGVLFLNGSKVVTSGSGLVFDSSGNLGLGVTPSAWGSFYKAIQGTSASEFVITSEVNGIEVGRGYYKINAGFASLYTTNQAASKYDQTSTGEHRWFNALSGTAGNPISFSQVMTLDASGNLGLGVTPSAWSGSFGIKAFDISGGAVYGSSSDVNMVWNGYFNASNQWTYKTSASANLYSQDGAHKWYISTDVTPTAGNAISFTQAMTLDASGNLLVGTTTAASRVTVNLSGAYDGITLRSTNEGPIGLFGMVAPGTNNDIAIGTLGNNNFRFFTNGTANERARIPAVGGMVVGTAALATAATDGFLYVPTCAGTPTGTPTTQTGTAPIVVDTTNHKLYFYSGGTWRDAGP